MSWIFLLCLSFATLAETELEPINVEAKKDIDRFTFSTSTTIPTREIENQPLGLISPELEKVSGVIANQNGGPGGRVSFFIRGTEGRHVSFTLDGLKINDTSNTDRQFDGAFLTSPIVKNITVYKGPQAVLYGSDAMGGMIEITSRKGENAPETRLNVNAGSFGTIGSTLANDWKTQGSSGTLTATRFHSDGISRLNEKRFDGDEEDATDITQLTSSSMHQLANKIQTDLLFSYLHGKAEQDSFASDNSSDLSRNDQYILQQKTNFELADFQAMSLRNGFNRHQRKNESVSMGSEFFNGNLIQHELIHRMEIGPHGFITGLSTEHESAEAINLDRSFDLHSAFFQTAFEKNDVRFHAGIRADKHSKYGSFYTGSMGLGYSAVSFQYSRGYKAPSLYQLYGPDSFGSPVGNPNLVPETNHYLELAWKKDEEVYEAEVSLFQNRLSNLFTYSFGEGYLNQQRFIAEGVEFSGKLKRGRFDYFASFTHQQFREEEAIVLRRPYNTAQGGISWFPQETLEINANARWFSSRKDFGNTGIVKLNSFEVVDLGVRKSWERDDLSIQLKNIFGRDYEEIYGFNILPRSLFGSYGHRF